MVYSGAWGKTFTYKNLKSKISWHCPFNSDHCLRRMTTTGTATTTTAFHPSSPQRSQTLSLIPSHHSSRHVGYYLLTNHPVLEF